MADKYVAPRNRAGASGSRFQTDEVFIQTDPKLVFILNSRFPLSECLTFLLLQPKKIFLNFSRNSAESIAFIWVVIVVQMNPAVLPLSITLTVTMPKRYVFIPLASVNTPFQAIDAMNGYGYDHLILSVEWSENRKKDAESTDKPSGYQSRVRKH